MAVKTSVLAQELAPLHAKIEQVRKALTKLEGEMRAAVAELETFSAERQRFDALRDACQALRRLDELKAGQLFWGVVPEVKDSAGPLERLQGRIETFDGEIRGVQEKQTKLKAQGNALLEELDELNDEIRNVQSRDERRQDEFVIERELSKVPHPPMPMPWSEDNANERRYRRSLLLAMFLSLFLGGLLHLVNVPVPVRPAVVEIPERLAMLVRKEKKKPEPPKVEKKPEKKPDNKVQEQPKERPQPTTAEQQAARTKAESTGVLAFKESFADLIDETPVARLGADARLSNQSAVAAGEAQASRSLVAMQSGSSGSSGGINNATVSRNVGSGNGNGGGIGKVGVTQVKSALAGLATKEAKPLSSGSGPARTDEEIQILFDRYKSALYRIYNTELRKDPTLRGKMVLRITIEPSGAVSACSVDSSNINSPELAAQIVARVTKINFGVKEGVPKITILYPIDFLPAG